MSVWEEVQDHSGAPDYGPWVLLHRIQSSCWLTKISDKLGKSCEMQTAECNDRLFNRGHSQVQASHLEGKVYRKLKFNPCIVVPH